MDDLVETSAAWGDEGLAVGVEDVLESVAAEARVRAEAAIVEDRQLQAVMAVPSVGHAVRVFGAAESNVPVAAVAEWLQLRLAAAAERELRSCRQGDAKPVVQRGQVRWQGRGRRAQR